MMNYIWVIKKCEKSRRAYHDDINERFKYEHEVVFFFIQYMI